MGVLYTDVETYASLNLVNGGNFTAEGFAEDPRKWVATSPYIARIACIGFILGDARHVNFNGEVLSVNHYADAVSEVEKFKTPTWIFPTESDCLEDFAGVFRGVDAIATFCGRGFDIPLLFNKFKAHRMRVPSVLCDAFFEARYKTHVNIDLQELVTGHGATSRRPGLREVCIGYGLPDPKAGCDGGSVQEMVERGEVERIARYCMGDVQSVVELHKIWMGK